jgi:hypothetical protein
MAMCHSDGLLVGDAHQDPGARTARCVAMVTPLVHRRSILVSVVSINELVHVD